MAWGIRGLCRYGNQYGCCIVGDVPGMEIAWEKGYCFVILQTDSLQPLHLIFVTMPLFIILLFC
uniref:Uncharacterized protein n=1 Tax=Rhizophora mucronata TaxID=61149 RepID=A0A2P2QY66_RHIMU